MAKEKKTREGWYRLNEIRLDLRQPKEEIPKKLLKKLQKKLGRKGRGVKILEWEIVRESIDARHKKDIKLVYTVDFRPDRKLDLAEAPDLRYSFPAPEAGAGPMARRPVVVGFGPAGMFCALVLARAGYRPLVIERGSDVDQRVKDVQNFWETGELDTESNVQFGEGGAGTFSDGKLTTGIHDARIRFVLETFAEHGADPDIVYQHMPHIGTDVLRGVVKRIREEIISLGGEVRFRAKMEGIHVSGDGAVEGIEVRYREPFGADGIPWERILTENLVLALGHSARDTFRVLLEEGMYMEQKPFSIGVRIEHPQKLIDQAQYGEAAGDPALPPAVYKLNYHCRDGRGVYTFCMCPGGEVIIASSQEGGVVTNGMSLRARGSGTANSGLLVDVRTSDFGDPEDPLAGVKFQEYWEHQAYVNGGGNYQAPKTSWADFRDEKESAKAVIDSLPDFASAAIREAVPQMGRRLKGFDSDEARMTAVEARSSSPVRLVRDRDSYMAVDPKHPETKVVKGLFPGGEGAGYAGGITSAACDGIRIAEQIILHNKPAGRTDK